ncbi:MAG: hypothetical protein ACKPHU_15410, partial [Planctomycetaceae bacterium]
CVRTEFSQIAAGINADEPGGDQFPDQHGACGTRKQQDVTDFAERLLDLQRTVDGSEPDITASGRDQFEVCRLLIFDHDVAGPGKHVFPGAAAAVLQQNSAAACAGIDRAGFDAQWREIPQAVEGIQAECRSGQLGAGVD